MMLSEEEAPGGEPLGEVQLVGNAGVAVYPPGATFGPRRMRDWEFV